jgi:hypothetical protein
MPEISRFLGIVIAMYYREHGPPHFHAIYGDFEVTVEIESGRVNGILPSEPSLTCLSGWGCIGLNYSRRGHWPVIADRFPALNRWSEPYDSSSHRRAVHIRKYDLAPL